MASEEHGYARTRQNNSRSNDGFVYIMHYSPTSSVSTTDPDTTAGLGPTNMTVTYITDDGTSNK
jgi:hypothetical protein